MVQKTFGELKPLEKFLYVAYGYTYMQQVGKYMKIPNFEAFNKQKWNAISEHNKLCFFEDNTLIEFTEPLMNFSDIGVGNYFERSGTTYRKISPTLSYVGDKKCNAVNAMEELRHFDDDIPVQPID